MESRTTSIPDVRQLTEHERGLIRWMLEHGTTNRAEKFISQLDRATVVARCSCGCASIDLAIDNVLPESGAGLDVLGDFIWSGPSGEAMGAFVFAKQDRLAGLEVYSVDGQLTPRWLPQPTDLRRYGE